MLNEVKSAFAGAADFTWRDIEVNGITVSVVFIDGLCSGERIGEIIRPITRRGRMDGANTPEALLLRMMEGGVYSHDCKKRGDLDAAVSDILGGSAAVFAGNPGFCLTFEAKGFATRGVEESGGENVSKGAKDCFIENLRTNTALVRRKIKNPALKFTSSRVGRKTSTPVSAVYIEGLTNPGLVREVTARIDGIDIDALVCAAQLEEYIADNRLSAFPQSICTERADKFCAGILGGRVGILIDGLPVSYLVPGTLPAFLSAPEDYSQNFIMASGVTLLRNACFLISLLLPAFYIAVVNFHQEMIPTPLALSIIEAKRDVPFTSSFEIIGMLAAFEILLEAGMRLPKPMGQAVSILGALVVGQAAVEAKIVSPAVVIAVALTGIAGFTSPNQDMSAAIRVWRLILTVGASFAGMYGLGLGSVLLLYHLCRIKSFGVPYLSPLVTGQWKDVLARTAVRPPMWTVKWREEGLGVQDEKNQK